MILLPIHIGAALLSLASGAVAMVAAKGDTLHRKSGMIFVVAMLVMTSCAVLMATFWRPNPINVVAGALTFYLVSTGLLTVRRRVEQMRGLTTGFLLAALMASAYAFALGFEALRSADGTMHGTPPQPLFMFGVVGLLGALGDARMLLARSIVGSHRLARHLWRMSFAMWIATTSAFLGQAKFLPEVIRKSGMQAIPVLLVTGFMIYWLVRVLWKRRTTTVVQPQSVR
jgi:uncharacterized membrane protein